MRLQSRLFVTTLLAAVPLVLSLLWYERHSRYAMIEASLSGSVLDTMRGDALDDCERSPSSFVAKLPPNPLMQRRLRGQGPGAGFGRDGAGPMPMRLYAYGRDFRAHNPQAPTLDPELVDAMHDGRSVASRPIQVDDRAGFEALVAIPSGKACSYVLAQRPVPAIVLSSPFQLRTSIAWLFPTLGLLGAVYLGLGLLVRRVSRLTRDVKASASRAYAELPADSGTDEIAELRQAFRDAGQEIRRQLSSLETNERVLREFLGNTTHDVMLPLTVLQGHLAALAEAKVATSASAAEALAGALRESFYIGALLRNLALKARLDGGQPVDHRDSVDLGEIVARATERNRFLAAQQGVELNDAVPDLPIRVPGDSVSIEQAVSNVIYNAVAYNRVGGHVAVLLEQATDDSFLLRVTDDGPGVAEEELARLVDRHYRGDSSRSRSQGAGLGLNIAHRVADLHGWQMSLSVVQPNGLEVSFHGWPDQTAARRPN
jgi:signal transduction histidine kinase